MILLLISFFFGAVFYWYASLLDVGKMDMFLIGFFAWPFFLCFASVLLLVSGFSLLGRFLFGDK